MISKWTLLTKKDVSPNKWFPVESRTYQLPNGKIVEDFTVTTIKDVSMVIPITTDHRVVLVNQYKPGVDEVVLEFPAGRLDESHPNLLDTARLELEQEVGIKVDNSRLHHFAALSGFTTKGSEIVHMYLATDCVISTRQSLDETEDIEVVTFTSAEIEKNILNGKIWTAQTIAAFYIAKAHFPHIFITPNTSH